MSSKLLESHVHLQLSCHLNSNTLLFPYQSGFGLSQSTQTLLLHWCDKWYKALDSKTFISVAFLDISKAFNTVNHELLLSNFPLLASPPLLSPGSNLIFPTVPTSLTLLNHALLLASLPLVFLKALLLVPPSSPSSSMTFLLSFLRIPQFLLTTPHACGTCPGSVMIALPSLHSDKL